MYTVLSFFALVLKFVNVELKILKEMILQKFKQCNLALIF